MKIIRLQDEQRTILNLDSIIKVQEGWALDVYNNAAPVINIHLPNDVITLNQEDPVAKKLLDYLARQDYELITVFPEANHEQILTDKPTPDSIIAKLMGVVSGTFTDYLGNITTAPVIMEANHDSLGQPHLWCVCWWPGRPSQSPPVISELADIFQNEENERNRRNSPHDTFLLDSIKQDTLARRKFPIYSIGNHDQTLYSIWPGFDDLTDLSQIDEHLTRAFVQERVHELSREIS